MKTRYRKLLVSICLLSVGWYGCGKEENPGPSLADVDWYRIEDDPNDELQHLRYNVYRELGVSIFCTDTLGSEIRYNRVGEPYTYYEVLKIGYKISSSTQNITRQLNTNREELLAAGRFVRDYFLPRLPESLYPRAVVLLDELKVGSSLQSAFRDQTATYVSNISTIKNLTEAEKESLATTCFVAIVTSEIISLYDEALMEFFRLTNESISKPDSYKTLYGLNYMNSMFYPWFPTAPEVMGFLWWHPGFYISTITSIQDVESYLMLVYDYTESEVAERYGEYEVVMAKYYFMKELIAQWEKTL